MDKFPEAAVEWAAKRLLARPERRKVLIVLSDGSPCCGDDDNDAIASHLRRILDWLEKKEDVDVVAIGLRSDCVKEFYRHHAVARTINELPEKLYKALLETMKK
jgi:cobalamin biosynthesis protein CobT